MQPRQRSILKHQQTSIGLLLGSARNALFLIALCSSIAVLSFGCRKTAGTRSSTATEVEEASNDSTSQEIDACTLITKEEVSTIQASPISNTNSSANIDGAFRVAQCYYTSTEPNKSVSLALTQRNLRDPSKRGLKDYWRETFGRFDREVQEHEGDKEKKESIREQSRTKGEEEESTPPRKIEGVGEEAYWTSNRVGGALYVLKKNVFIRISVGGPDNEETKLNKSKALAQKALDRL
jgi:hypothetical protein